MAPSFGEGLAGKASAQHVMGWQRKEIKFSYVTKRAESKIFLVKSRKILVGLAGKDTPVVKLLERKMKPSESGKEINET